VQPGRSHNAAESLPDARSAHADLDRAPAHTSRAGAITVRAVHKAVRTQLIRTRLGSTHYTRLHGASRPDVAPAPRDYESPLAQRVLGHGP
jgi:hypothetical protein